MIRFEQVSKRYSNGHQGLDNLSFHIRTGEMVFITGHSGAGKSTLLKLIMCMERPSSGAVHVGGQNLRDLGSDDIPYLRRQVGVVFQNHQLLFDRTVFDNVALPLIINGTPSDEVGRRVRAALDKVGLLSKENSYPIALSGGEQQRVGIARAVVHKPALLLADEPNIREVIAFPLNQKAQDLMMGAPNLVSPRQLRDVHVRTVEAPKPDNS